MLPKIIRRRVGVKEAWQTVALSEWGQYPYVPPFLCGCSLTGRILGCQPGGTSSRLVSRSINI